MRDYCYMIVSKHEVLTKPFEDFMEYEMFNSEILENLIDGLQQLSNVSGVLLKYKKKMSGY